VQRLSPLENKAMNSESDYRPVQVNFVCKIARNRYRVIDDIYTYTPFFHYIGRNDTYYDLNERLKKYCEEIGIIFSNIVYFPVDSITGQILDPKHNADAFFEATHADTHFMVIGLLIKESPSEDMSRKPQ
jgi:hypothetical protein